MKNNIITPKTIMLVLAFMPIVLNAQGRLLYESIYSYTGNGWQDDGRVMKTYNCSAFYAKIYENCLVETSGSPQAKNHYYTYIGNNNQNERIYQYNSLYFLVDRNYNLTRVIQTYDYRFGTNVKKYLYSEIKKGDLPRRTPQEILDEWRRRVELMNLEWNLSHSYYN